MISMLAQDLKVFKQLSELKLLHRFELINFSVLFGALAKVAVVDVVSYLLLNL